MQTIVTVPVAALVEPVATPVVMVELAARAVETAPLVERTIVMSSGKERDENKLKLTTAQKSAAKPTATNQCTPWTP